MSDSIDDGGQAFPTPGLSDLPNGDFIYPNSGMSLRDWFAGQMIAGLACHAFGMSDEELPKEASRCAAFSYAVADAMIEERAKR